MGLPKDKIDGICMDGSIHDIGGMSVPAELLSKPTKLSELELSLIKEHANKGFEIMKNQSKTKQALIQELSSLRQMIEELEQSESKWKEERKELIKRETRFRSYFNSHLHGIAITSPENKWVQVNDRICSIMGYSRDEIIRMTWSEMTHPDDITADLAQFERVLSGQIDYYTMNKRFIRKDGKVVWTNLSVECVRKSDGSVDHIIAMVDDITSVKLAEKALQESEDRYRRLFENANEAIFVAQDGKLVFLNPVTSQLIGYSSEELMRRSFLDFIHPDDQNLVIGNYLKRLKGEDFQPRYTFRYLDKNGAIHWMEIGAVRIEWAGRPATLNFCTDITDRKRVEEALRESEMKYRLVVDNMVDVITITDMNLRFTYVSPSIMRLRGFTVAEVMEQTLEQVMTPESLQIVAKAFEEEMKLDAGGTVDPLRSLILELEQYRKDGSIVLIESHMSFLRDEAQKVVGIISLNRDITDRKQAEEKIRQLAYHDTLTGLPNRKLFSDRLGIALAQAQRNQKGVAVTMIDLDNFKDVNDTLGHDVGDLLLKAAAARLSAALRKGDTVARFGGDEFVLILPDLKGIEDVIQVAQKIVDSFRTPFLIDTHQLIVTTSIGIAVYPHDGTDNDILLKNADKAMYQAKQTGRDQYQLCKEA
ncbi:MAG: PAS domain S-box protein [Syntrophales bacterium]|jgi:diguanylate cyclase (GGDEF)-like protein/PAS domain S-box-containing protein|nr:PAS domain S-box protein [Syntrophales bacterium]